MYKKTPACTDLFKALDDLHKLFKLVVDVVIYEAEICESRKRKINKSMLN